MPISLRKRSARRGALNPTVAASPPSDGGSPYSPSSTDLTLVILRSIGRCSPTVSPRSSDQACRDLNKHPATVSTMQERQRIGARCYELVAPFLAARQGFNAVARLARFVFCA